GSCPSYTVDVYDDGSVGYDGGDWVAVTGHVDARIDEPTYARLLQTFLDAHFFDLGETYEDRDSTCAPSTYLTLSFQGRQKCVRHYDGDLFAPASLSDLENAV